MGSLSDPETMDRARKAQAAKMAERKAKGLPARETPYEQAIADPRSRQKAINAMCWQCQGEYHDPNVQWRIGNCEVGAKCALYHQRPHQRLLGTEAPPSLQNASGVTY